MTMGIWAVILASRVEEPWKRSQSRDKPSIIPIPFLVSATFPNPSRPDFTCVQHHHHATSMEIPVRGTSPDAPTLQRA